jgi:hypothetical protein
VLSDEPDVDVSLTRLLSIILEFLSNLSRKRAAKGLLVDSETGQETESLKKIVQAALFYGQMTIEDVSCPLVDLSLSVLLMSNGVKEETWASDPNAFVEDEDEENPAFNLRIATQDLVSNLVDAFGPPAIESLWTAFQTRVAESDQLRASHQADWCAFAVPLTPTNFGLTFVLRRWKGYEGALAQIGTVSQEILEYCEEDRAMGITPVFNLAQVFDSTVLLFLGSTDVPFLQGRTFVFASKFAGALPAELADRYVGAALAVLEDAQSGVPVKISAVRAIQK